MDNYEKGQQGRASFRVALNIAEGSAKFSKPDRKNYFTTARGSLLECIAILDMRHDQSLISTEEFIPLQVQADEPSRILYSMIQNLEK